MNNYVYFGAIACFLLTQCTVPGMKIMPGYKSMNVEKSKLGVVLVKESMAINNPADIAEFLGEGESKEVFWSFFTSQFNNAAKKDGKFASVAVMGGGDASCFVKTPLCLSSGDTVRARIPSQKNCAADSAMGFLLILDTFNLSRDKKEGTTMVTMGPYGMPRTIKTGAYDYLILKGAFALWDNAAGKVASFGKISEKLDVSPAMTKQTWITLVENIASRIFINTPYGKQSEYTPRQ